MKWQLKTPLTWKTFLIPGGLVLFLLFEFCLSAATAEKHKPAEIPIRIGLTLPLSGDLAAYGEAQKNGAILAAEEINKEGGVSGSPIELITEDNAFSAVKETTAVQKLIDVDHIDALLTGWTPMTLPIIPIIDKAKLPTFTWMTFKIGHRSNYLFNIFNDFTDSAREAVRLACKEGIKRASYISALSNEVEPVDKAVHEEAEKCGITLSSASYEPNTNDFKGLLTRIKTGDPQSVFVCAFPHHFPLIIKQLVQLGMDNTRLFDLGFGAPDSVISKGLEKTFEKMQVVSTWYSVNPANPDTKRFLDKYRQRFLAEPEAYAAYTYDALHLFAKAFEHCSPGTVARNDCVVDALLKTGSYPGAAGLGTMDQDGDYQLPSTLVRYRDGRFRFVD